VIIPQKEPKVVDASDDIVTVATPKPILRALKWRLKTTA
jgi:hypothetical protein